MQIVQIQPEAVEIYCERLYLCKAYAFCAAITLYSAYSLIMSSNFAIFSFI